MAALPRRVLGATAVGEMAGAPAEWGPTAERSLASRIVLEVTRLAPWAVLAAFVAQLAVLVPRHEPWFDEAQAWLIARDSGLIELFTERLRYEGSTGLWHLLLMPFAKLGLPYATVQVIGAAAAVAGAFLLLRFSPFPLLIRAGLCFSYVIGFQYAVVARSYTLLPLLLFALAMAYPTRIERVGRFALLLALIAGVSLHGLLIAAAVGAVVAIDAIRQWGDMDGALRRRVLLAAGGLLLAGLAGVAVLWPPDDLTGGGSSPLLFGAVWEGTPRFWNSSLSGNPLITGVAALASIPWFWRTRTLALWFLPTILLLTLSVAKYHSPWHDGIPLLVWIFALWVSLRRDVASTRTLRLMRIGVLASVVPVILVQGAWWVQSYRFDFENPYSGSRRLAAYLETLDPDLVVHASGFYTLGALPYLDGNPYDNYHEGELPGFYVWSRDASIGERETGLTRGNPDIIVRGVKRDYDLPLPEFPGYVQTGFFDGQLWWKNRVFERDAFAIYERTS